jgi:hypothetical protein
MALHLSFFCSPAFLTLTLFSIHCSPYILFFPQCYYNHIIIIPRVALVVIVFVIYLELRFNSACTSYRITSSPTKYPSQDVPHSALIIRGEPEVMRLLCARFAVFVPNTTCG